MAGVASSFEVAEEALRVVGEMEISARQVNKLTEQMGGEMAAERDARTERYVEQPLPRQPTTAEVPIEVAAVFCDGGRMRTRTPEQGHGIHRPHWRETKNAAFHRMRSKPLQRDPQPDLPDCFRNQAYVEKLVNGLKNLKNEGREELPDTAQAGVEVVASQLPAAEEPAPWQPETLFRTCLSSLAGSGDFGAMMAAEADARGFFTASRRAFVGDGQGYNWSIQQLWFPTFTAVTDFVHAVEYVYSAAKAIYPDDASARWQNYVGWANACWQGRVSDVIDVLARWLSEPGPSAERDPPPENDPRTTVQSTLTYLSNNQQRMDYSRYRRAGLPVTSSLAESLVKQINHRVKGTEKFWNDGPSGEAILQLRAALISDGDRLQKWIVNRQISSFSPRCQKVPQATSA